MNSFTGGLFWEFMSSGGVLPSTKLDNLQNFFRIDPRAKILNEDKLGGVELRLSVEVIEMNGLLWALNLN